MSIVGHEGVRGGEEEEGGDGEEEGVEDDF